MKDKLYLRDNLYNLLEQAYKANTERIKIGTLIKNVKLKRRNERRTSNTTSGEKQIKKSGVGEEDKLELRRKMKVSSLHRFKGISWGRTVGKKSFLVISGSERLLARTIDANMRTDVDVSN